MDNSISCAPPSIDEFLAAVLGEYDPADAAAFVATILREQNFDPNEPRDERGRWTAGGSSDDWRGTSPYDASEPPDGFIADTLPGNDPNEPGDESGRSTADDSHGDTLNTSTYNVSGVYRKEVVTRASREPILAKVRADVQRLLNAGEITQQEAFLRYEVARAAVTCEIRFGINRVWRNSYYWSDDRRGRSPTSNQYHVRADRSPLKAIDDAWRNMSGNHARYRTGCAQICELVFLKGLIELCKWLDNSNRNDACRTAFDVFIGVERPSGFFPIEASGPFHDFKACDEGFTEGDLMPGDRVWMDNPYYQAGSAYKGEEGCNAIYLGNDRFIVFGVLEAIIFDYKGLQWHVYGFNSVPKENGGPRLGEFRIIRLYRLIVPPFCR